MNRVSFASKHVGRVAFRQIQHDTDVRFGDPEEFPEPDWLVIFDEPPPGVLTRVPRARRIVILTEPPEIKPYRSRFLEQFGVAISPMRLTGFSGTVIRSHAALPWFYGTETLDELRQMPPSPKINAVSVVITRKTKTPQGQAVMAHTGGGGNTLINVATSTHDKITVEVNTLDLMSVAQNFPTVDLLKIDCEGFEMPILHGAAAVLAAPGTRLVFCECEFHKGETPHGDFFEIYQHLTPLGYKFVTLYTEGSGRDGFIFGSALFLRT